ncbi:hypothetical protein BRADI_3g45164v3 [Brachypodium distachyon]|uniref:Uncharacterized protein n=1 Tax=Brachypodium distachyon TaxID=15368 RepID=A0A0Q3M5H2_BRADI|nr:hypothetical protein BRADI_3g45164v3 [Brachypodium distachyon]
MVQITIPPKVEKQFRPLLSLGSVYMLTDVSAIHATYKKFIYHHQSYMLQFKTSSKVHLMQSRGVSIPRFSFVFDQLLSKDNQSKPLLDLIGFITTLVHTTMLAQRLSTSSERSISVTKMNKHRR